MMTDPAASRPGTHLDPDRMADLLEGLLDTAAADEARAHLASCPVCSADFALISGEADLGELLPPAPIPHDVVARIEAALYREPPLGTGSATSASASVAGGVGSAAGSPSSHSAVARPRRRFRMALGVLAGASLVIVGGIGVVTALSNVTGESKSSDNSAASGSAQSSESAGGSRAAGAAPSTEKGLSIEQQAKALLGHRAMTPAAGPATSAGSQCSIAGVASDRKPLAGTQTQYAGKTVWLLIYTDSTNAAVADVYVIDAASCNPGDQGQILDQFEIPRA